MPIRTFVLFAVAVIVSVALSATSSPALGVDLGREQDAGGGTDARSRHFERFVERARSKPLPPYQAEPLAATVVNADSGEPLEGVIVVAHWEVQSPYNGAAVAEVMVMETMTDTQGKFAFPAWGPTRPDISLTPLANAPWTGRLMYNAPALLLFKSDYMPLTLANPTSGFPVDKGALRHSYWNGKTIKLKPVGSDLGAYGKALVMFDGASVNFAFSIPDCSWKRIPRLILALSNEAERLKTQGRDWGPSSLDNFDALSKRYADRCGSLREFMSQKP